MRSGYGRQRLRSSAAPCCRRAVLDASPRGIRRPTACALARRSWPALMTCTTLPARPSRKARSRSLASGVALRDGGHQRLGEQAVAVRQVGDARQRLHHRVVGHRRVAGDALGQLDAPWPGPRPSATRYCDRPAAGPPRHRRRGRSSSCRSCGRRRSGAGCAPSRRRRRTCRAGPRAGRRRCCCRRRGCAPRWRARGRRRPLRRAAPRSPARGRTGPARTPHATCANAARPGRRCARISSDRSRPAQKCSPSPLMTTARARLGQVDEAVCSCGSAASLSALRLAGAIQAHVERPGRVLDACSRSSVAEAGGGSERWHRAEL